MHFINDTSKSLPQALEGRLQLAELYEQNQRIKRALLDARHRSIPVTQAVTSCLGRLSENERLSEEEAGLLVEAMRAQRALLAMLRELCALGKLAPAVE